MKRTLKYAAAIAGVFAINANSAETQPIKPPLCVIPPLPDAPEDTNLRLLSWNIQQIPSLATQPYPEGRENCQREMADKFDVAVMQEAFLKGPALEKNAAWSWRPVFKAGDNVLGFFNEGFRSPGLLARAKDGNNVQMVAVKAFSTCSGLFDRKNDCLAQKGFQMFRVGQITFVNLHMDAGGHRRDSMARTKQLDNLFAALPVDGPLVLAGDFNIKGYNATENAAFEILLERHGLRIALHEETDVIAVRGEGIEVMKAGVIDGMRYSDHNALFAYMKIRPDLLRSPPDPGLQIARLDP